MRMAPHHFAACLGARWDVCDGPDRVFNQTLKNLPNSRASSFLRIRERRRQGLLSFFMLSRVESVGRKATSYFYVKSRECRTQGLPLE